MDPEETSVPATPVEPEAETPTTPEEVPVEPEETTM